MFFIIKSNSEINAKLFTYIYHFLQPRSAGTKQYNIISIYAKASINDQYKDLREYLYGEICLKYQHFKILSDTKIFNIVMSSFFVKHTAEYLYKAYNKRGSLIYN